MRVSAPVRHDVTDDVQRGDGAGENAESVDTDRRRASGGHGQPLHLHLRHGGLDVATGTAVGAIRSVVAALMGASVIIIERLWRPFS